MSSPLGFKRILPKHQDAGADEEEVEGGQGGQDDVGRVPAHLRPSEDDDANEVAAETDLKGNAVSRNLVLTRF